VRPELWQRVPADGGEATGDGLSFREWPLFEDVQLFIDARRLSRKNGGWSWGGEGDGAADGGCGRIWRLHRMDADIFASTRRFEKQGHVLYCVRCLVLIVLFVMGVEASTLARLYEGCACACSGWLPQRKAEASGGGALLEVV